MIEVTVTPCVLGWRFIRLQSALGWRPCVVSHLNKEGAVQTEGDSPEGPWVLWDGGRFVQTKKQDAEFGCTR